MTADAPDDPVSLDTYLERGFTRPEAFTLLRDAENARNGVTSIAYPSPEIRDDRPSMEQVVQSIYPRLVEALAAELASYITHEDVERIVQRAMGVKR